MLVHRLATGSVLVAVFVAVLYVDERFFAPFFPLWFVLSFGVMGWVALEMIGLLNVTSARPSGNTVFGGVLAMVVANWAPHVTAALTADHRLSPGAGPHDPAVPVDALAWPLWAFVGIVMFSFVAQSLQFDRPGRTMATIAGTLLATAYVGLLGSFVLQMRWLEGASHGVVPLVALLVAAKGADIGAYTLGRLAGRHKLWPKLSPNKTREGAVGGLLFSVLGTLVVVAVAKVLTIPTLNWYGAVAFGLMVGTSAQLGDLMESMIKRDCMRKDASDTLPGFGGVLDVMDSLLFAGPVAYGFWLLFGP
jgi:phosphatidate cytidylyltransferase